MLLIVGRVNEFKSIARELKLIFVVRMLHVFEVVKCIHCKILQRDIVFTNDEEHVVNGVSKDILKHQNLKI